MTCHRGSNQYRHRGGVPAGLSSQTVTVDEVAWAFHPEHDRWAQIGFGWQDFRSWTDAGGTYDEAVEWTAWKKTLTAAVRQAEQVADSQQTVCRIVMFVEDGERVPCLEATDDDVFALLTRSAVNDWDTQHLHGEPVPSDARVAAVRYYTEHPDIWFDLDAAPVDTDLIGQQATLLTISRSDYGESYLIGTYEDCDQRLVDYVNQVWDTQEAGPKPVTDHNAVAQWFGNFDTSEWYRTDRVRVPDTL